MYRIKISIISTLFFLAHFAMAQTMSVFSPALTAPFQVTAGTVVTFEWDAFGSAPTTIFTHSSNPVIQSNLPPDAAWMQLTNWTGSTGGKYYIDITANADIWVFGGISGFIGWQYSNVLPIQIISTYAITASDSMICPTNGSVTFTAPTGTGYTYQWYDTLGAISGETSAIYNASSAGSYYCEVTISGTVNTTNTLSISSYEASFTGALANNQITMTADQTFASYQWFERTAGGTSSPIIGAINNSYIATVTTIEKWYSYQGVINSCTVVSDENFIIDTLFTTPLVTLNNTVNSQGYVCAGTLVSITSSGNSGMLTWFKNGQISFTGTDSVNMFGAYQNGTWMVAASPLNWPNISISSNSVVVNITQLISPDITGANFHDKFCPGDIINMILTDEGYSYTWYVHDTLGVYGPSDVISVPTGVYSLTFSTSIFVTIVAEFNGCETTESIQLRSWADDPIYIKVDNYTQRYLCTDSTVNLQVESWNAGNYNNYQWFQLNSGTWNIMTNETLSVLNVQNPGEYKLHANPNACPTVTSSSNPFTIHSYLDREPFIYADKATICEGETVVLRLSGGFNWYAKQWLGSNIVIGSSRYVRTYTGLLNNSASDTQEVFDYSSYQVSAKHNSCPNGLKVRSNIVFVKPTVSPEIVPTTSFAIEPMHIVDWDSTNHIIGCLNEPVSLTLNDLMYTSIEWFVQTYAGDDDYALGTKFHTGDTASNTMDAKWVTAVVIDAAGCKGQSTPLLLDSRVFNSPAIASSNNSELCNFGDSTFFKLAFPGTWISYKWFVDGVEIPGETNDSIWAKQLGMYTISGFPADCPTFEYSSGVGPFVKFLYAEILENDTLIYAMPELGFYTYQWFFNGDSVDAPVPNRPFIFPKDQMQPGVYTVEVSNDNCTKISLGFVWNPTGISKMSRGLISIYPNPTIGILNIDNLGQETIGAVQVSDMNGKTVISLNNVMNNQLDVSELSPGIYFVKVFLMNGGYERLKFIKQ